MTESQTRVTDEPFRGAVIILILLIGVSFAAALMLVSCTPDSNSAQKNSSPKVHETPAVKFNPAHHDPASIDDAFPPALAEVNFQSRGKRLNGIIYQANGPGPHPTVILLHGYPGNEKNLDLAQAMRRAGYNVLFFHYRGAWGSGGEFSFSHVIEDVSSAAKFLREKHADYRVDASKLLFVGHSMGGFAALHGAARDETIKCVAGIAPANVAVLARAVASNPLSARAVAAGADSAAMLNGETALADLADNGESFDIIALAPDLAGKSVLLVGAEKDKVLPPDAFHTPLVAAYSAQEEIKLTHALIPGDHSFSWSRIQLIETVLNWAESCEASGQ